MPRVSNFDMYTILKDFLTFWRRDDRCQLYGFPYSKKWEESYINCNYKELEVFGISCTLSGVFPIEN
jgi:hypothetical protein